MLYISQITNFNGAHNDMPIYKTLEKSWILKISRKESIFLYSKRHKLQFLSTYRGIYLVRCGRLLECKLNKVKINCLEEW